MIRAKVNRARYNAVLGFVAALPETVIEVTSTNMLTVAANIAAEVKTRIARQEFPHQPLSPKYLRWKKRRKLDLRILVATGDYLKAIQVNTSEQRGKAVRIEVGFPPHSYHRPSGLEYEVLARAHEFGVPPPGRPWPIPPGTPLPPTGQTMRTDTSAEHPYWKAPRQMKYTPGERPDYDGRWGNIPMRPHWRPVIQEFKQVGEPAMIRNIFKRIRPSQPSQPSPRRPPPNVNVGPVVVPIVPQTAPTPRPNIPRRIWDWLRGG